MLWPVERQESALGGAVPRRRPSCSRPWGSALRCVYRSDVCAARLGGGDGARAAPSASGSLAAAAAAAACA